jgi:carboxyl-terminal processing protease
LSEKRRAASKDFAYVMEDIGRTKERLLENRVSVNEEKRLAELKEASARDKERNEERRKRYESQTVEDRKILTFYRLNLEQVDKEGLTKFDPSEEDEQFMRRAKDATASLDETPKWPSGLDPIKREGLMIVRDLVEATEAAKLAGLIKVRDTH